MNRIGIVEDEAACRNQLTGYLKRYEEESGERFEISCFADGDEIVEKYRGAFDILLMDIEMPFMDGMSAAREIREKDSEVVIIFITNMAQYAIQGYAVDALDYVLKPVNYFIFAQKLERALGRTRKKEKVYLNVAGKNGVQKIDISQLRYVESRGHRLTFHMKKEVCTAVGTMKEMEEKLVPHDFFRCNNCYIVNLEYVTGHPQRMKL